MEIQDDLKQIKSRQLKRLIIQLEKVNTPQIIIDAVEKHWNFFYLDVQDLLQGNSGNNDNSNKRN